MSTNFPNNLDDSISIPPLTKIVGEKGDKGDKGDTGDQGIQGLQGDTGDQGLQGIQGIQGIQGVQGIQGIQGLQGLQGNPGTNGTNGIDGILIPYPVYFLSYEFSTNSSTFVRCGTRELDLTNFPATHGAYSRQIKFIVTFETSVNTATADVRLFDYTNNTAISGASSSTTNDTTTLYTSSALTVGSSAGNIRDDAVTIYEVQVKMSVGNPSTDRIICSGARMEITYV